MSDMLGAKVLLVAGGGSHAASIRNALLKKGCIVIEAATGNRAVELCASRSPHVIVFDCGSMRSNGSRICRRLREIAPESGIIVSQLPAQNTDRKCGADLFLTLPYTPRKLLNRIRALLPANMYAQERVVAGSIEYYRDKRTVVVRGQQERRLTPKLAALLEQFLLNPGVVLSRRKLMKQVWKTDYVGDTRTLEVHVRWLREALEVNPALPQMVLTRRGIGYMFVVG